MDGGYRGLEITGKPLHAAAVIKAFAMSGPPIGEQSWFVHYTVRRPIPSWRQVERSLRCAVKEFREQSHHPPREMRLGRFMRLRFLQASRPHRTLLLLGGSSDNDAGGFLVAELARNLRICISEKLRKVAPFRSRYAEWWLALEDRIAYGSLDSDDIQQLREALGEVPEFTKVILVNPLDRTQGIELLSMGQFS